MSSSAFCMTRPARSLDWLVETIAFTRGVPTPEALPIADLADCAKAAVERDGKTILNYGPVGGYGPLREWVAERHGVAPGQVLVTNGSLHGGLAARRACSSTLERRCSSRARPTTAPCTSSPDTKASRSRSRWTRTASTRTRSSSPRRVPLHDPDLPESVRPRALARAPPPARRARARRQAADRRGRPVLARALRGRAAAEHLRARRAARASSTRSPSRRSRLPACASATSSARRS